MKRKLTMKRTVIILVVIIATGMFICCGQNNNNNNQNIICKKIDFNLLEEKAKKEEIRKGIFRKKYYEYTLEYEDVDSSWHKISGNKVDGFVEWTTPKLPLFYKVYSEYYGNGILKLTGYCIGKNMECKIDIWEHFDKNGNKKKEIDEDTKYGAYNCSYVMVFLHAMKHINIETGEGRESLVLAYDEKEKIWQVLITDKFDMITEYKMDGETGDIILDTTYSCRKEIKK